MVIRPRYFFDTEFNEDGKTIDLISIGVVCEDGREFYACNSEAELHRVNPWVRENVLPHLPRYGDPAWMTRAEIAAELKDFFQLHRIDTTVDGKSGNVWGKPEIWAYYADYDWVALCQLYGAMVDLPKGMPMFCMDLKQALVMLGSPPPPDPANAHDALADARWNRDLFMCLAAASCGDNGEGTFPALRILQPELFW